jgi:hypothetical protein
VSDPPTPTLPVKEDNPLTLSPPKLYVNPVTEADPPIPVFPDTIND